MKMLRLFIAIVFLQFLLLERSIAQDWPNVARYQKANGILKQEQPSRVNVVYMGDSITDYWINASPDFFANNHFVDRGISGQTTPQMLLRFRGDVIELRPKAVVLLCGTNDIAGNTGPSTLEMIEDNIQSMTELANVNKIKSILCSVLPANKFGWKLDVRPADSIITLNAWIKDYAHRRHLIYVDYYSLMVDENKGLKKEYSEDGVHPNKAGYMVMEKLVLEAVQKTL